MTTREYNSPCGQLLIGTHRKGLFLCDWIKAGGKEEVLKRYERYRAESTEDEDRLIDEAARQLDEYFGGHRKEFDLPLKPLGTDFQKLVWNALKTVKYGKTSTYKAIAESINRPSSVRAVANAIGANPVSIILPCHRIIGSDGSLTGYAGGLKAKKYLLELEDPDRKYY